MSMMHFDHSIRKAGVYEVLHVATGRRYIGSSRNIARRWIEHRSLLRSGAHHSKGLQELWQADGEAGIEFNVICFCDHSELAHQEQRAIDRFSSEGRALNTAPFAYSSKGRTHTEQAKRLLSMAFKGRTHSAEHRAAISSALTGKTLPQAVRRKISAAKTGCVNGPLSDEHRAKLSAALAGRPKSAEHVERMKAIRHSDDAKRKISAAKVGVRLSVPRDPEHTRRQQEARMRTLEAKRSALGV